MFVFIKGSEGISSKTNKEYQVLMLAQYVESNGKVKCKICEFFPERKINLSDFDFGDILKCEFKEPEFFGDFPKLISVEVAYGAPYIELFTKYKEAYADKTTEAKK